MKLNLTGRFVLILLTVGLIPLLVIAGLSLKSTAKIASDIDLRLKTAAGGSLETIERNFFERYGDVQAFATNHVLFDNDLSQPAGRQKLTDAINTYVRLYGLYTLSVVTDAQGKVIAANTSDAAGKPVDTSFMLGKDCAKSGWFRDARDGRFLASDVLTGTVVEDVGIDPDVVRLRGGNHLTVGFSAPIMSPKGEFLGVWRNLADYTLIAESIIQQDWRRMEASGFSSTVILLVNKDGTLVTRYNPHQLGSKELRPDYNEVMKLNLAATNPSVKAALAPNAFGTTNYYSAEYKSEMTAGYAKSAGALGYPGLGWSIVVQDNDAELHAGVIAADRATYLTVGVSLVLLLGVAFLVARSITRPIQMCVGAMEKLAKGDLTTQIELDRSDELGVLAKAINVSIANLRQLVVSLSKSASDLLSASQVLTETANNQAATAEETTVQANTVASAGEQLSSNSKSMAASASQITQSTSTVAAAMEEMSSSIQEVARNCANESEIARKADTQARQTRDLMGKLDESARQIGKVVELINRIAEQTNLLALNATIEAASAGEAGRGFAVVANEVKELARQSAAATEDIRKQVSLIQDNAGASMRSLDEVAKVIEQVSHISSSIAASVEEQSATTSEIVGTVHKVSTATSDLSLNVQQTSEGASEVARNISGVSQASADVAKGAVRISASATQLDGLATTLGQLVGSFKV
jgi:methyl-accepting chemotaxis protein